MDKELERQKSLARKWQSKAAVQAVVISKLRRQLEASNSDKAKLLADLKWMRGEHD